MADRIIFSPPKFVYSATLQTYVAETDSNGDVIYEEPFSLDSDNYSEFPECSITPLFGKQGFLSPPRTLIEDKIPMVDGGVLRQINVDSRKIDLPFLVRAPNYNSLSAFIAYINDRLVSAKNFGRLVFSFGGIEKELWVTYSSGLEGDDGDDSQFIVWSKFVLSFVAHDPYFYSTDAEESSVFLDVSTLVPFFTDGEFLVFSLVNSNITTNPTINNPSPVNIWPVWTIVGPVTGNLRITNNTTGKFIQLDQLPDTTNILDGEEVVIDTRPGFKTVESNPQGDIFSRLGNGSSLFPLIPKDNNITISASGLSADSSISYEYKIPYLTL